MYNFYVDPNELDKSFRMLVGTCSEDDWGNREIDGIEFNNDGMSIMVSSVEGLETPPIRNNNNDWSGRDGGYMSSQLYGGRTITISGFYWDVEANCNIEYEQRTSPYSVRERLTNYLQIRHLYPIFIKFINGRVMYTEGYMTDFNMPYEAWNSGEYQITFYCPQYELNEAEIYGDPNSIWRHGLLHKEIPGGHLVPENLPVLFELGQRPVKINYTGLIPSYPTITMKGPATNPTFINIENNAYFRIGTDEEPWSMVAGQTLTINMASRQVLLNGKSNSMFIDPNSSWWFLTPGTNTIYMLTDENSDTDIANIDYTINYQGV